MYQPHAHQDNVRESNEREDSTRRKDLKRFALLAVVGLLLVAGGLVAVWFAVLGNPAPREASLPEATQTQLQVPPPPLALPTLDRASSDPLIEDAARSLSTRPEWGRWLASGDLARRAAAAIGAVARGDSPAEPLSMMAPESPFEVVESRKGTQMAASSFARYDRVTQIIAAIDPRTAATAWMLSAPVIRRAWAEISPPDSRVEDALSQAITRLVSVKVPEQPLLLQPRGAIWTFADPALESLPGAEKHLLRMGPTNQRLIQARLQAFGEALNLPLM